jgi:type II pantothenate kinase
MSEAVAVAPPERATVTTHASAPAVIDTQRRIDVQTHRRTRTNTADFDNTIHHPGSVKINVEGAFIVERDSSSPQRVSIDGANHETTDIRLPNHTAVVSHIAVDVGGPYLSLSIAWS